MSIGMAEGMEVDVILTDKVRLEVGLHMLNTILLLAV
jgi:hypothetical protein